MSDQLPATDGSVCIIGSLNADLIVRTQRHPRPGETVQGGPLDTAPGGKSANQAVAAARLGARVRMVGAVGDDPHGQLLRDSLAQHGVDIAEVRTLGGTATGTAVITVSDDGENTIVISPGANGEVAPEHIDPRLFDGVQVLALTFEIPARTVVVAARAAREAGVRVILNPSPFRAPEPELLAATDLLVVNAHEMAQLIGQEHLGAEQDWEQLGRRLRDATGVAEAVVTLGPEGAAVLRPGEGREGSDSAERIPGHTVQAIDTTGAGDAVTGTLAAALAAGAELSEAVALAMRVGAISARGHGAQPSYPSRAELSDL